MALTDNLISYWKLDETSGTRYDSHGSNNLTDVNTVGYATGKISNCAVTVAANNENLRTVSAISSTFNGISALSFNFWYKSTDTTSYNWLNMFHDGSNMIGFQRLTTTWDFRVYTSTVFASPTVSASSLEDGNWHMVTGVYDGAKVRIYLDGTESGSGTSCTGNTSISSSKFGLFARPYDDAGPISASMDEVGIWTRALTSTDVTSLYNSGSGLAYPFSSTSTNSNFFAFM